MLSLREWRAMSETVDEPVAGTEPAEPEDEDWAFYDQKIHGRAGVYLKWLIGELENKKLSPYKKGFIVQGIMDALGMDIPQVVRITNNIKRAFQKRDRMAQQTQSQQQVPQQPQPMQQQAPQQQQQMPMQQMQSQQQMGFRA